MDTAVQQPKSTMRTKKELASNNDESKSVANGVDRYSRVAVSAYYKSQARAFKPGNELADWLAAEAEENQ